MPFFRTSLVPLMFGFLSTVTLVLLSACTPTEPDLIVVTEVVHLGDEQIVITRLVELQPTATPTIAPPAAPPEPVSLDIAYETALPDLDPQRAAGKAALDMAESLFVGLTRFNHERQLVEPLLASSWRISNDGRTWTFLLRDDIAWVRPVTALEEGTQQIEPELFRGVDAYDVVYAFKRACSQENAVPDAFLLFIIEGCEAVYPIFEPTESDLAHIAVEALDERTVQVRLTEPASDFITIVSLPQFRPVPHDLVEEFGNAWTDITGEFADGWQTPENIVVNGPFVPAAATFDSSQLLLYRNSAWPLTAAGNVDQVNIQFDEDQADIFADWQRRLLDTGPLPASEREEFLATSADKARLVTNHTVFYVGFNYDSPVFGEVEIRRAFNAAIDRSSLSDDMFEQRALGLRHFTPPGAFGAPPSDEVGVGYSPDYALLQMDRSSVRNCKLLPPITFLVSTADLSLQQAELLRDMWVSELDCDEQAIQIEQVEFGRLLNDTAATAEQRPDIWELAWPAYYPDAHNFLFDLFHCTDGENRQNRACSEIDGLLREARITSDPAERQALYRNIENLFFAEQGSIPVIPLYARGDYVLVQSWLDFTPAIAGGEQFDTYKVDQETKRLERSRS